MRNLIMFSAGLVLSAIAVVAAPINGLFNTGVDSGAVVLAGGPGTVDPHWTVLAGGSALVAPNQPGFYLPQTFARFVNTNGTSPEVTSFTLLLQFDLTGFDPATASFGGRFAADNCAVIKLNGNAADSGGSTDICGSLNSFGQYWAFGFTSGFVTGLNTISVEVTNIFDSPGAALVEFTASDVQRLTSRTAVPEPGTWAMTAAACLVLAGMRRFRR